MNAAAGRKGLGNHAAERVLSVVNVTAADVATLDKKIKVFKFNKAGFVSNFALRASDLDSNGVPTLVLELGDGSIDAAYMTSAVGQAGGLELTNAVSEATEAGAPVAAGDEVEINIGTAAATGAAGTIEVSFDYVIA
jgi:hypothetical protein